MWTDILKQSTCEHVEVCELVRMHSFPVPTLMSRCVSMLASTMAASDFNNSA